MERIGNKVSYIKKPFSRFSFVAVGLLAVSLVFAGIAVGVAYGTQGNAPLYAAALGLCSMVTAAASIVYGIFSFFEKEKNYLLAKIGLAAAGTLLFIWLVTIVVAL